MWTVNELIILIPTLVVLIAITCVLFFTLRNKSEKAKKMPFIVIAIFIIVFEVVKQIISIASGYNPWHVPLHFCSMFLYFFPLAVFTKGKLQTFCKTMSSITTFWLVVVLYASPSLIIAKTCDNVFLNFFTFHTFVFHHVAILWFMLSIAFNFYTPCKKHALNVVIGLAIYYTLMVVFGNIFNINFCYVLGSQIGLLDSIRTSAGYFVYIVVLYLGLLAISIGLFFAYLGIYKLRNKKKN